MDSIRVQGELSQYCTHFIGASKDVKQNININKLAAEKKTESFNSSRKAICVEGDVIDFLIKRESLSGVRLHSQYSLLLTLSVGQTLGRWVYSRPC